MRDSGALYFSDVPSNTEYCWTEVGVEVSRRPSEFANGHTTDGSGRLITCEHRTRSVTRREHDGTRTTIASHFDGRRLNSPNDVVCHSDGSLWFTDPDYGIRSPDQGGVAAREQDGCFVFRVSPDGETVSLVADDFEMPNGLAFSPDESVLYVADSAYTEDATAPRHVRALGLGPEASVTSSRVLFTIDHGWPDGLRVDREGRIWCAAGDGVRCYSPEGALLGTVVLPEAAANLCFAEVGGRPVLIATATSSVYSVPLKDDLSVARA
ncbi:MAG: SMP-30/gluconolactonase/LRE family protein [Microcella sp.]|nr:MAG: SMP-30/gluconolactonase/LRE family protein [Microcella sp.]